MPKEGWIKVQRKLAENKLWLDEPFTKGQAWVDLLLLADWTENKSIVRGKVRQFHPGTVYMSILELSKRWKWSQGKVRRFLEALENDNSVRLRIEERIGTAITLENWAFYQNRREANREQTAKQTENRRRTRGDTIRSIEENKEDKERAREATVPPFVGGQPPAIGAGDCLIVLDGFNHRFPKEWKRFADDAGMSIEDYVRMRHQ